MAKLYAISGPQGSGKSTVMAQLDGIDAIYLDPLKVSREVQRRLGLSSLDAVNSGTFEQMLQFQNMVLEVKDDSLALFKRMAVSAVISERSFIDIAAYFLLWVHLHHPDAPEDAVMDYVKRALKLQLFHFDGIIYVPAIDGIEFEHDPQRASESSRQLFEMLFMQLVEACECKNVFIINSTTVDDRKAEILKFLGI